MPCFFDGIIVSSRQTGEVGRGYYIEDSVFDVR